jgi:hypothetical protein
MLFCALAYFHATASAGEPGGVFEVVAVTPSPVIEHEVDLKGRFDKDIIETFLKGPQLFSHTVGLGEGDVQDADAYLNWYKIERPVAEPRRVLSVRDPMRGKDVQRITLENAAFLLSPSQRVTSGPPSQIPAGLNPFKAYKIVGSPKEERKVKVIGRFGPGDRVLLKAAFLCVPVEHWHHDVHFPIKNPKACMLVYETLPHQCSVSITTLDLFGLNGLKASSGKWICVPAEIVQPSSVDVN